MLFANKPIIATLLVRDEEDILEFSVNKLVEQGVEIIIATDNDSKDSSKKILQKFKQVKIIIEEKELNHNQRKWVTRMAKLAATEYDPSWIIHVDADEFWVGLQNLHYENHDGYLKVPTIYQHPPRNKTEWSLELAKYYSLAFDGLPNTMPKVIHRPSKNAYIGNGNHTVSGCGSEMIIDYIEIHHYPVRTYNQFERKVTQGATALLSQTGSSKSNAGTHWKKWYDSYIKGELESVFDSMCEKCCVLEQQGNLKQWK